MKIGPSLKKSLWWDSLLSFVLFAILGICAFSAFSITENMENRTYDFRLKLRQWFGSADLTFSDQILLVEIDNESIAAEGRWPWARGKIGDLLRRISLGEPRVIGVSILYTEPDRNQGLESVRELKQKYDEILQAQKEAWGSLFTKVSRDKKYLRTVKKHPLTLDKFRNFSLLLSTVAERLDQDAQLAEVFEEIPNVVLPMSFSFVPPLTEESEELLDQILPFSLKMVQESPRSAYAWEGYEPLLPLPRFAENISGVGHVNVFADPDGSVRGESLILAYQDEYFPSLSLEMARVALGVKAEDIRVKLGEEILIGSRKIPLDADNRLLLDYQGSVEELNTISAVDILRDKIPSAAFKGKIVLLGTRATGIGSLYVTPMDVAYPPNGVVATVLQNILSQRFMTRPAKIFDFELFHFEMIVFSLIGLFVTFLLPRLKALLGFILSLVLFLFIVGAGSYLFVMHGIWVKIVYSAALVFFAYLLVTIRRFFFTEHRKELVEAESIETNKMLGLSFQGQGMLDMAFEKFRKCPIDDAMKELLYNLALDFERKRQFSKAAVVYEHISKADSGYRDTSERLKASKTAGETMVVGPGLGGKREGTVVIEGAAAKPTLGRYEIQKELGRGAMGIVYLGKDPKINRSVAIKTLRFEDDVDEESAKEFRERFFREAESAGALSHPNIIRIFDAGEDNEIAYIAMELLDGEDLKKYCVKDNLLEVPQVLEYMTLVADALNYAHSHGVIHRDIKPANIMRLKDGTLRVTDYGIARITASSKTQTGTVMGTPSYMSPEQIAGKKVDGRADIFSLGVMLYELLTGEKPFDGDSIATLLFKISNETHPDPVQKSPDRVTPCVRDILAKALQKDPDQRYQNGNEMAQDLRECIKNPFALPPHAGAASVAPRTIPSVPEAPPAQTVAASEAPPATPEGTNSEESVQKQPSQDTESTVRTLPAGDTVHLSPPSSTESSTSE